jgi:hypothetical protein
MPAAYYDQTEIPLLGRVAGYASIFAFLFCNVIYRSGKNMKDSL